MGQQLTLHEINQRITKVLSAGAEARANFVELIKLAGLDPARDLRFANWSGVSFAGLDLTGCDFTGALLHQCDFTGSTISRAKFEQAEFGRASIDQRLDQISLSKAKDWSIFGTRLKSDRPTNNDSHLGDGAVFFDAAYAPRMVVVPGILSLDGRTRYRLAVSCTPLLGRDLLNWKKIDVPTRIEFLKGDFRDKPEEIVPMFHDVNMYLDWLNAKLLLDGEHKYRLLTPREWVFCFTGGARDEGEEDLVRAGGCFTPKLLAGEMNNRFGIHGMYNSDEHVAWEGDRKALDRAAGSQEFDLVISSQESEEGLYWRATGHLMEESDSNCAIRIGRRMIDRGFS